MLLQGKKTAIIGGGPGGLALARLLQQRGAAVTVYERDADRYGRQQGATLDLHAESGLRALAAAGLLEAFKARYRPGADQVRLLEASGRIAHDDHDHPPAAAEFGHEHFRPEIDRGPLRDILLDSLAPGTVAWNSQLLAAMPAGAGWQLTFKNGLTAAADLLIGADGASSKVRPLVTDAQPFYVGLTAVEGSFADAARQAPTIAALLQGGKLFAFGEGKTIIVSAKGDGGLAFYTGQRTPEAWARSSGIDFEDAQQVAAWFKSEFAGWAGFWQELVQAAGAHFVPRPQYCMPLHQHWRAQPNVTLLGDAAHLMPPYAGEGVNMALLDALELSQCLTSAAFPDLRAAIGHYETAMRTRASATAEQTLEAMEQLHSAGGLAYLQALFAG